LFLSKSPLIALLALILVITGGMLAFHQLEGMSYFDALWLTVVSIATVGYSDMVPHTAAGRTVAMVIIVSGVALFTYVLSTLFLYLMEGHLGNVWGVKRMTQKINSLHNHIIVCGAGRVGKEVITHLKHGKNPFVVIEKDPALLEALKTDGILYIAGDATEDRTLTAAGVHRGRTVITTLPEDAGNLFITITCKDFNPDIRVVARANRPESAVRFKRAGADYVISPAAIAGNRMALAAIKPASVAFVQTLIEKPEVSLDLEELLISQNSSLAYRELRQSGLREKFSTQLLAIIRNEQTIVTPEPSEKLLPGDLLIVFGPSDKLTALEAEVTASQNPE